MALEYKKISDLTEYTGSLAGSENLEIEKDGQSYKIQSQKLLTNKDVVDVLSGTSLLTAANLSSIVLATAPPFVPVPWNKSMIAKTRTLKTSGTADTDTTGKLVDSVATFVTDGIAVGDIVWNTTDNIPATVLLVINETTLWLNYDAFPDGNEGYAIYDEPELPEQMIELTGELLDGDGTAAADTDTVNHLIDADSTDWTTIVSVDDWAMNLNTGLVAKIDAVAAHDLTLQWDCFPNGNEPYLIFADKITISDSESLLDGQIINDMNISQRFVGAGLTSERILEDISQKHWHIIYDDNGKYPRYLSNSRQTGGSNSIIDSSSDQTMYARDSITDNSNGTPRTGELTRPRNQSQVFIMRIK